VTDDEDDEEERLQHEVASTDIVPVKAQASRGARSSTRKRSTVHSAGQDDEYLEEVVKDAGYEEFAPVEYYSTYEPNFYKPEDGYKTEEFYTAKPEAQAYYKPEEYAEYANYYYQPTDVKETYEPAEPLNGMSHLGLTINTQVKHLDRPASAMDGYPRPSPVQDGYRPASAQDGYKAHNVLEAHGINFKPTASSPRALSRHLPRHLSTDTLPTPNPTPTPPPFTFPPSPSSRVSNSLVSPTTSPTNSKLALLAALCSERLSNDDEPMDDEKSSLWRSQSMPEMAKLTV